MPDAAAEQREADSDQRRNGGRRRTDRAPPPAGQKRDRDQHAELRLVGQEADQHAREPWPAIEPVQRAAKQRCGEESILAVADIDEHGREGGRGQQRFLARQDGADRGEVARKAGDQPDRQPPRVGNGGDEDGDRKEERRIVPAIERHLAAAEDCFLCRMLERGGVGLRRAALPGQCACRIYVGKIGADRLAVAADQPVGSHDPSGEYQDREAEQDQAVGAHARHRQPCAGSQARSEALPDMSHFTAEFCEYCAVLLRPYRPCFNVP